MYRKKLIKAIRDQLKKRKRTAKPLRLLSHKIKDLPLTSAEMIGIRDTMINDLMITIRENYQKFKQNNTLESGLHFICQNGINACAVDLNTMNYDFSDWRICQRYFSHKLIETGYLLSVSQTENKTIQGSLHSTIRYYLKPSYKNMMTIPMDQKYGNVSLELVLINDKMFRFIIRANYYNDRNYQKEKPFKELLNLLSSKG